MKSFIISLLLSLIFFACKKSNNCTEVVVTLNSPLACRDTSLIINKITYRVNNLPSQYAIEGNHICIEYILYEEYAMCPCCGGTKVRINRIH